MMNGKDVIEPGQLRTWKDRYFMSTPPTPGWERFVIVEQVNDDKWTVLFPVGRLEVMTAESIERLSRPLESE